MHGLSADLGGVGAHQSASREKVVTNPVAQVRHIDDQGDKYDGIMLWCPGCQYEDDGRMVGGAHMLPVSGDGNKRPTWAWNGDLVNVTLEPSILTRTSRGGQADFVCHSFLRNGQWQFLGDCTHHLANQTVPMLPLPDWLVPDGH